MITYDAKLGELQVTIIIPDTGRCSISVLAPVDGQKGMMSGPHETVDRSDLRVFFQTMAKLLA